MLSLQDSEDHGGFRSGGLDVEGDATDANREGGTRHREISGPHLGRWRHDKIEERAVLKGRRVLRPDQKFVSSIFSIPYRRPAIT